MAKSVDEKTARKVRPVSSAERDVIALGIAIAAIILFVGTGGTVMPQIVRSWMGVGSAPDLLLTNAVLLNIALLIFGWRRYKDLHREVAERRLAEEKARELAEIDPLTSCLNRRSGAPAVEALCESVRGLDRETAVVMVDLDNFKQINDINGHRMGDRVLKAVAERISAVLPEDGIIARIGGDEFICALTYKANAREQVEHFANEVITAVSAPIEHKQSSVEPTVSVGIATTATDLAPSEDARRADTLIHRADIAMYHAKKQGRNRFHWFEPQMEDELRFRNELETGIRKGISAGEFVPYYEQQIDLESGQLMGFEMLARWESPRFGLVSPEVFIPIAEEIDLIGELSECLIRQALLDAKDWDPSLTLSVNISPIQLRDPWFAQKLLQLLFETGFPPSRLEIEITESCVHENIGAVRSMVVSLRNQGIRISLDDFGTGYSSLSQLRSLPFDRLKIDRSFVSELTRDGGNSELVEAIVSLGKGLALPVTAEGIESSKVLEALQGMGQLKGQGYLYGRPENAEATRHRLAELRRLAAASPEEEGETAPQKERHQAN